MYSLVLVEGVEKMAENDRERAIRLAKELYERQRREGVDFRNGPCLSEEVIPDWCVDVVHIPRETVDNRRENQCRSYRSGRTHHFVELDLDGNLVRAV